MAIFFYVFSFSRGRLQKNRSKSKTDSIVLY
jgi:hypothetical protein